MKSTIYLLAFIIICSIGCSGTMKSGNDTTVNENITIIRFDKEIYEYLQNPDLQKESELKAKYPLLLPAFGRIAMDDSDPSTFFSSLREYFSHPALMKIYKDELSIFSDLSAYETELNKANTLIAENLSGRELPQLAMHVSGFRENVIILNNIISISADKYLGSEYTGYKEFFQSYERMQMQPEYLVRDFIKAWLMADIIKSDAEEESLLSAMVQEGKVLYALSLFLPEREMANIIGYSSEQITWCKQNEKNIWQNIVKKNQLFSTDHMIVTRFMNDAPYTATVSEKSPGRVGAWVGWQIVNQYARKKGASLEEIINLDAQAILKDAKYNP